MKLSQLGVLLLCGGLSLSANVFADTGYKQDVVDTSALVYSNADGKVAISYIEKTDQFQIEVNTKHCKMKGVANIVEDNAHVLHMDIEPEKDKTNQVLAQLDGNTQEFKFISAKDIKQFCQKHTHFFTAFK